MTVISFTAAGIPATAGSKRGFYNAKSKRVIITDDSARSRPWKAQIADAAREAMTYHDADGTSGYRPLLDGPLEMRLCFYVPRPKGHIGKRGVLPSAPVAPTVKPDLLKMARAVEDALSGVVYRDDAQIVDESLVKRYGEPARVEVYVSAADLTEDGAAA